MIQEACIFGKRQYGGLENEHITYECNGQPVCWFANNQNEANAEIFKGRLFSRPASEKNGYGAVVTKRDENGRLEGLVYLTKEEAEDYRNGSYFQAD